MSEYQYRAISDKPVPEDLPWEDERELAEEHADVMRAIGFTGVGIQTRLRPQDDCCAADDWEVSWSSAPETTQ